MGLQQITTSLSLREGKCPRPGKRLKGKWAGGDISGGRCPGVNVRHWGVHGEDYTYRVKWSRRVSVCVCVCVCWPVGDDA